MQAVDSLRSDEAHILRRGWQAAVADLLAAAEVAVTDAVRCS